MPRPEEVWLEIVAGPDGKVFSATPVSGLRSLDHLAIISAKASSYKPFLRDDVPVFVKFPTYVSFLPPDIPMSRHVHFPMLRSGAALRVTLERSSPPCPVCQAYSLEIDGDGSIIFEGEQRVAIKGSHIDHVKTTGVSTLIDGFKQADFYSLPDSFDCGKFLFDLEVISITVDGVTKTVTDCGSLDHTPQSLVDLQKMIDQVAGSEKWIKGTAEAVSSLRQEGFDFFTPGAVAGLTDMINYGTAEGTLAYLAAGVPIADNDGIRSALEAAVIRDDREIATYLLQRGIDAGDSKTLNGLLHQAARCGDKPLFDMLIRNGADANDIDNGGRTLLMDAANSTDLDMISAILQRHRAINGVNDQGRTALFETILGMACGVPGVVKRFPDAVPAIRLLVAAGADLNHQNNEGSTPLHSAGNPSLPFVFEISGSAPLHALIQLGAKLNVRDKNGATPLLATIFPDAALALIKAGADITLRDHKGRSILDLARMYGAGTPNLATSGWQQVIAAVRQRETQLAEAQPESSASQQSPHQDGDKAKPVDIVIAIDREGNFTWNGELVTRTELEARMKRRQEGFSEKD